MVEAAWTMRYAYVAITDHAPNLWMQRMTKDKMLDQRERLGRLQARYPKMQLLHGTELNIDPDGAVDWDDDFLRGFDVTVAAVHSHFELPQAEQTRRLIRAIEHPMVQHHRPPDDTRIGRRSPIDLDLEAVFEAAARTGTALEINSHPDRLDLRGRARPVGPPPRRALRDRHRRPRGRSPRRCVRFGVATAQRGWLTSQEVINAWPISAGFGASCGEAGVRLSRARLVRSFFDRPAVEVAPDLLGRVLVRREPDGTVLRGRLVEAEAYEPGDPASHGFRGRTRRNAMMFGPPGRLYVYLTYGQHWMMNVVTRPEGEPSAVLLRALEPLEGQGVMAARRGSTDPWRSVLGPREDGPSARCRRGARRRGSGPRDIRVDRARQRARASRDLCLASHRVDGGARAAVALLHGREPPRDAGAPRDQPPKACDTVSVTVDVCSRSVPAPGDW